MKKKTAPTPVTNMKSGHLSASLVTITQAEFDRFTALDEKIALEKVEAVRLARQAKKRLDAYAAEEKFINLYKRQYSQINFAIDGINHIVNNFGFDYPTKPNEVKRDKVQLQKIVQRIQVFTTKLHSIAIAL